MCVHMCAHARGDVCSKTAVVWEPGDSSLVLGMCACCRNSVFEQWSLPGDFIRKKVCSRVPEACACPLVLSLEGQSAPHAAHGPCFLGLGQESP